MTWMFFLLSITKATVEQHPVWVHFRIQILWQNDGHYLFFSCRLRPSQRLLHPSPCSAQILSISSVESHEQWLSLVRIFNSGGKSGPIHPTLSNYLQSYIRAQIYRPPYASLHELPKNLWYIFSAPCFPLNTYDNFMTFEHGSPVIARLRCNRCSRCLVHSMESPYRWAYSHLI